MKVYLVTEGDYSSYNVCGVFSTREKAKKYIKYFKNRSLFNSGYDIEEHIIDPIPDFVNEQRTLLLVNDLWNRTLLLANDLLNEPELKKLLEENEKLVETGEEVVKKLKNLTEIRKND